MPRDARTESPDRTLRLELDWRWHRPKHRAPRPKGEPRDEERPLLCITGDQTISAAADCLPFECDRFDMVECGAIFAYVRNDEGLVNELGRIVAPGGIVRLETPAKGPLAVLDAFNLHRYLVDITKRGLRPFETADIGWRRHYSEGDLVLLFGPRGFTLVTARRTGFAASEAVRAGGFVLCRWWRASRNWYRRASGLAERVRRAEDAVEWRHGFWLDAEFRKGENAARSTSEPR
jgi:SAM-dependent methyltransferase